MRERLKRKPRKSAVRRMHMDEQAANTFVWFADEPKHHLFISGSPEVSEAFLTARFAARVSDQR